MTLKKKFGPLCLVVVMLAISACTTVTSTSPVGFDTYVLDKDHWDGTWVTDDRAHEFSKDEWEGNWITVNDSIQITVTSYVDSEIEINFLEKGELHSHKVLVRKIGKDSYLNLINDDGHYVFAKFRMRNKNRKRNKIIIWPPSDSVISKAFEDKELTGETRSTGEYSGEIRINSDEETLNNFYSENRDRMLFYYEDPIVMLRISR